MRVPAFIVAVALAATAPARADVDSAIAEAKVHAAAGDYGAALSTIRSARAQQDEPDLIFVEAQLLRISGDCEQALARYDEFLATTPPQVDRTEAELAIEACGGNVAAAQPVEPVPDPTTFRPAEPPTAQPLPADPLPAQSRAEPPPPRADRLGLGLWISGGVLLAAGVGAYAGSWALRSRGDRGDPTLDDYLDRERRARTVGGVGIAAMSVGASILVAAGIRHLLRKRKHRETGVLSSIGWPSSPWR